MKKQLLLFTMATIILLTICSGCAENETGQLTEIEQTEGVAAMETYPITETDQGGENSAMDRIWEIEDPDDFVIALSDYIAQKCQYGDNMTALSGPERVFYITQILEMEVNNGGFSQFFYNSGGDFSNELADAFSEIGAVKTAAICTRAVSAFGRDIPVDREERLQMLDACESDEIDEILDECDNAFYEYVEDLSRLNYEYVMNNKEAFT